MTAGEAIGSALWIMSSINIAVALVGLLGWIVIWGVRFQWWSTRGGLLVYLFAVALFLWSSSTFLGNVGSSTREWWQAPGNDIQWWYAYRYVTSVFVLIMVVAIDWTLVQRLLGRFPPPVPGEPADPLSPPLRDPRNRR